MPGRVKYRLRCRDAPQGRRGDHDLAGTDLHHPRRARRHPAFRDDALWRTAGDRHPRRPGRGAAAQGPHFARRGLANRAAGRGHGSRGALRDRDRSGHARARAQRWAAPWPARGDRRARPRRGGRAFALLLPHRDAVRDRRPDAGLAQPDSGARDRRARSSRSGSTSTRWCERLTGFRRNVTERTRDFRAARIAVSKSASGFDVELPRSLKAERRDDIAVLFLARAEKRNAIDDPTVFGIEAFFAALPDAIKAVVLAGEGDHSCSGPALGELTCHGIAQAMGHARSWQRGLERMEFGKAPVVAVLHGAVVGGGLEIAAACHIRVAETSAYYALPEGSRGIFVGGGGSVRLPRLIGTARMIDMMLTGRIYGAEEGQAIGISHYLVPAGAGLAKGIELAKHIAGNAPMTNFAVTHVLPRIAAADPAGGYVTEALISAIAQGDDEAKARLKAFLEKRAPKTVRN